MSSESRSSGERQPRVRRRTLAALRWALLGLPLLLVAAYLARGLWLTPWLLARAASWARETQQAELGIGGLSGSWLGDLELSGVNWKAQTGVLRGLREGRVRLRFSPWRLLRGGLEGLSEVEIRADGLALGAAEEAPEEPTEAGAEAAPVPLPGHLTLRVELDRLELVRDENGPIAIEGVRLEAHLESEHLRIEAFEARSGSNHVVLSEGLVSLRSTSAGDLLRTARGRISLAVPNAAELRPPGVEPWPFVSADLTFVVADGRAEVAGRCDFVGGSFALEEGSISMRGSPELAEARLDLALSTRVADLEALGGSLGLPLAGRWDGRVDVHGTLGAPTGRFEGVGRDLVVGDLVLDTADFDLMTDGRRATLSEARVAGPGLEVQASGGLAFRPLAFENLALEGQVSAPSVLARLPFECRGVRGSARLAGPPTSPRGRFDAALEGARLGGREWTEARAQGSLDGDQARLEELVLADAELRAEASGWVAGSSARDVTGELQTLSVQWKEARCALVEPAQFTLLDERLVMDQIVLSGERGRARLDLELGGPTPRAALAFEAFEASALARLLLPGGWIVGPIDGHLSAAMAGGQAQAAADVTVGGVRWEGDPAEWRLGLQAALTPTELTIESLSARSSTGDVLRGALRVPFDLHEPLRRAPGPVGVELSLEVEDVQALTERLQGLVPPVTARRLEAETELEGSWEGLTGDVRLHFSEFVLPGEAALLGPCELRVGLKAGPEALDVEQADFTFTQGHATGAGRLARGLDVNALLDARDEWLKGALTAQLRLDLPDFGGLERLVGIRRASGRVEGGLSLTGSAAEPLATGSLTWREGELRLSADAPPVRAISADLEFADGLVRVESARGEIGGAPFRVSGTVDPRGGVPLLELALSGQNILLQRTERSRLRSDAELKVSGPLDALQVSGELILTEGRFTGEIRPLEELLNVGRSTSGGGPEERVILARDPPLAQARFDVRVRAANAFLVDTNLLEARLRPDCRLSGTGEAPTLSGPIYIESATLLLPSGKMRLVQGVLEFRPTVPFRPEIALTAEEQTQGYAVRASVTGSLDEFEITLSSTPPLSSDDLWVLVFTGQPPQDRWQDRSSQAMQSLALFLARDQLVRWLTDDPEAAEGLLERFEVEVGAKTSISGQTTGKVLFYLKPRSPSSGRATYLSAEADRYDQVNYALGIVFRPR